MTVIIFEGVDLSGKTYAIEKVAKSLNSGFVLKNAYKPKEVISDIFIQYHIILDLVRDYLPPVILDRFYPSQAVYSYLRGRDDMDSLEINKLEAYAEENEFLYIYVDTPIDVLIKRYEEIGDEHLKITQLEQIKERYEQFFEKTKMKKLRISTLDDGWLEKTLEFIGDVE